MKAETKKVWLRAFGASIVGVGLGAFGYALNHEALSGGIFLLVPFCTGLAVAFMSKGKKVGAITLATSLLLSLSILLVTGLEGYACVIMAFPILCGGIGLGALVGYAIGRKFIHKYGNITVIALCLSAMTLVGWTDGKPGSPVPLRVSTSMDFHAPMDAVWNAVRASENIEGSELALRVFGLPVPKRCTISDDGERVCYFEAGEMFQKVTQEEFGKSMKFDIVGCNFTVREWLSFEDAQYEFVQQDGYVEVIRTDTITSILRPRWYWHWFEERCVRFEHRFVMLSMKRVAEEVAAGG